MGKKTPGRPQKQVKLKEKRVIEIDSNNSEEVDFPFHLLELPDLLPVEAEQPNQIEQPNQVPAEEQKQQQTQVPIQPVGTPMEEQIQPLEAPVEDPNQPNQPNQNIIPDPMTNQQQLNWYYFKPEFAGKMDEDVEAYILRTNDWMDMHNFPNDQKIRRFCFTLTGKARLWYENHQACKFRLAINVGMFQTAVFKIWQYQRTVLPCLEVL